MIGKKRTEAQLVTAIKRYLQVLENAGDIEWHDRLNSGFVTTGKNRGFFGCRKGTPDIYIILNNGSAVVWVEAKSEKGLLSKDQEDWRMRVSNWVGHTYLIVRDLDSLIHQLKFMGVSV